MKILSNERKEELQGMFETIGNISDLKPVDCWLVIRNGLDSVPESFKQRVKRHCEAVDLLFNADEILNIEQNRPSQLQNTRDELKKWPAIYALECGPRTPLEQAYADGMIDSPICFELNRKLKKERAATNTTLKLLKDADDVVVKSVLDIVHKDMMEISNLVSDVLKSIEPDRLRGKKIGKLYAQLRDRKDTARREEWDQYPLFLNDYFERNPHHSLTDGRRACANKSGVHLKTIQRHTKGYKKKVGTS